MKAAVKEPYKTSYKLFDFFANCEYFEDDFDYDEVLKLPNPETYTRILRKEVTRWNRIHLYEEDGAYIGLALPVQDLY